MSDEPTFMSNMIPSLQKKEKLEDEVTAMAMKSFTTGETVFITDEPGGEPRSMKIIGIVTGRKRAR